MTAFLPKEDWLEQAKRLSLNMPIRVRHGREARVNLVIENTPEAYVAYCQSCKQGGRIPKEHVRLTGAAPKESESLALPHDMVLVKSLPSESQRVLHAFLVKKHIDPNMPSDLGIDLYYSESRKRLIFRKAGAFELGRDLTEQSAQKWITYTKGLSYLCKFPMDRQTSIGAVLVEDPLSWIKVASVIRDNQLNLTAYCALGTAIRDGLVLQLLKHPRNMFMFDGDFAGYSGAAKSVAKMRAYGVPAIAACAPQGMDPKDMGQYAISQHLEKVYEATL